MNTNLIGSKILVADDSLTITQSLETILKKQGYQMFTTYDGKQCLDIAKDIIPDLIITDIHMPSMNGIELCKNLKNDNDTSLIPIIILTASSSKIDKKLALRAGANDFMSKTFDTFDLRLKIESLINLKNAIGNLENTENIILSFVKAVEIKDKYTEGHGSRVSLYALKTGKTMGLNEQQLKDISVAGVLHDIGKIGIPDQILNKEGKLTPEEFEVIKGHPAAGEEICMPIKSFDRVRKIIRHHHEKLNGVGYPDGVTADSINVETRIMAIADIFDALTSNRSYRKPMSISVAFDILKDMSKKGEIDGQILEVFTGAVL